MQLGNPFEGFNRTSVDALLDMGFETRQVVEALTYLKKQRNYTPVGEIDKALDLLSRDVGLNSNRSQQSANNNPAVLKLQTPRVRESEEVQIAQAIQISQQEALQFVRKKSIEAKAGAAGEQNVAMDNGQEEEKKQVQKPRTERKKNHGVTVTVSREEVSDAYAWGDNRHG